MWAPDWILKVFAWIFEFSSISLTLPLVATKLTFPDVLINCVTIESLASRLISAFDIVLELSPIVIFPVCAFIETVLLAWTKAFWAIYVPASRLISAFVDTIFAFVVIESAALRTKVPTLLIPEFTVFWLSIETVTSATSRESTSLT